MICLAVYPGGEYEDSERDFVFIRPTFPCLRERESDTVGKFVGIKVDCKDSKFANKISPLCKNKIKLFQISCLTKPDPPSIFSITEFLLEDNFLPELSLSLKRIKVLVGCQLFDTTTTNPGLQLTSLILDLRPKGPL